MASKLELMKQRGSARTGEPEVKIIPRGDSSPDDYADINIDTIELNPHNDIYRQMDEDSDVELLAEDIRRSGLLHNLVVYPKEGVGGRYVLLSGERRYKALNYLQARGDAKWNTVKNCRVVTTPLSDNEKKVMLLSANLQVRGGFANEMIRRKAVAELVSCLQAEPYNLTAAEAKKAIKEATPINGRQIDKDLSIEKNLNEGLKDLLDRGFVLRSEAESFLRMTPEEQRIAAQMLQQLYAIAYNGPGSAAIQDEKKAIRGRFVDALRTVADTSSMQDAHEALVAAVFTVQKEMACLKETIRKVKTIPPEQPAAQVEQTEVIREVREKTAGAKAQSKITGKLSSQTSRLETMLRRKNPEKRLAEKYTHEERRQAMKELDEMIATATRLREIIAKVERSADEAQEV